MYQVALVETEFSQHNLACKYSYLSLAGSDERWLYNFLRLTGL